MTNEEKEFELYIKKELQKELKNATNDTEKVLKDQVQKKVYESYKPVKYNRTDNLKDAIVINIENDKGEVIFDENKLNHKSTVTGEDVKMVPQFLNYGHNDAKGDNMYHNYPARQFIEETVNIMLNKEEYKGLFEFDVKRD